MKKITNFFFTVLLAAIGGTILGIIHRFVPDRFRMIADGVLLFVLFIPNVVFFLKGRKKRKENPNA